MMDETTQYLIAHNIDALTARNPRLAERILAADVNPRYQVVVARSGHKVLRAGRVTFHSTYDPEGEAARFVTACASGSGASERSAILIVGFGFAYHVRAACRRFDRVHVFEPDLALLRCALAHIDLSDVLGRIDMYTDAAEAAAAGRVFDLWVHQPSAKHSPRACASLRTALARTHSTPGAGRCPEPRQLKILVVTPVYGGSLPIARSCHSALRSLGHDARLFDASLFDPAFQQALAMRLDPRSAAVLQGLFMRLMSEMVIAACAEWTPDLVFALSQAPISIDALQRLRQQSIATAFWFVEDYAYMRYWQEYAPYYDVYFTIQNGDFLEQLRKLDAPRAAYLPLAADPEVHAPRQLAESELQEFGSDVSFMGAGYYNRQKMFMGLLDYDFKIWGNGWNEDSPLWRHVQRGGSRIETGDTAAIFNATAVNINLHSSVCHEGVNPQGDYVNPRTFEIAACGAFQLVDERSDLARHFTPGREIITYRTIGELREKIDYYLNRPLERRAVAGQGHRRVLREHTYARRMQTMLEVLRECNPGMFCRPARGVPLIRDIEGFCSRHPETRSMFQMIGRESGALDMHEMSEALRARRIPLGRAEALFMLMHEYSTLMQELRT